MIGYITLGTNDPQKSQAFYDPVMTTLGQVKKFAQDNGWAGYAGYAGCRCRDSDLSAVQWGSRFHRQWHHDGLSRSQQTDGRCRLGSRFGQRRVTTFMLPTCAIP